MVMMKAIQVNSPHAAFEFVKKEIPSAKENEVLIKVAACGVCHGDAVVKEGHFPGIKYPRTPGHEVMGIIAKLGRGVKDWTLGQRIGVGWHGGHCFKCKACRNGEFKACENSLITGISTDGGYAEFMVARTDALVTIPDDLNFIEAAPLLCAGRTTFGGLKYSQARGGDLVAIHGLGGLGHLAVQYAVKLGFKTVVLSRGKTKEKLAFGLGAHVYIDTTDAANELIKMGGAKVILCTAPNSKAISELVAGLGRDGEIINVTGAREPMQIPPMLLLGGQRSIKGWVGGEIEETLSFSTLFKVKPMVEVFPLEDATIAYEKMMTSKVHFRSVLKIGS